MRINDDKVDSLIKFITTNNKEYNFFAVSVHGVGFEFRLKYRQDWINAKVPTMISIEDILNKNFSLAVSTEDLKIIRIDLTKEQYNKLYQVIDKFWKMFGERWEDRGLY